eukprot:Lankesteria_metandrocarpae@DN2236_c0_g1_i1.p1
MLDTSGSVSSQVIEELILKWSVSALDKDNVLVPHARVSRKVAQLHVARNKYHENPDLLLVSLYDTCFDLQLLLKSAANLNFNLSTSDVSKRTTSTLVCSVPNTTGTVTPPVFDACVHFIQTILLQWRCQLSILESLLCSTSESSGHPFVLLPCDCEYRDAKNSYCQLRWKTKVTGNTVDTDFIRDLVERDVRVSQNGPLPRLKMCSFWNQQRYSFQSKAELQLGHIPPPRLTLLHVASITKLQRRCIKNVRELFDIWDYNRYTTATSGIVDMKNSK